MWRHCRPAGRLKISVRELCSNGRQHEYFDLLGVKYAFSVDEQALSEGHRRLMRQWHPDRFANDDAAREEALGFSALVNLAYDTLRRPHLRARYILEQEGILLEENETAHVDEPEFLDYVMTVREELEDPSPESLKELRETTERMSRSSLEDADKTLQNVRDEQSRREMKMHVSKLQYLHRILEEIRNKTTVQ